MSSEFGRRICNKAGRACDVSIGVRGHDREMAEVGLLSAGLVGFPSTCGSWGVGPVGKGYPREIRPI